MGRPHTQIDRSKVEDLASVGCPPNEIAAELDCGEMTIHRRFGTVVKKGHERCKIRIRSKLFKEAMSGNTAALIFLGKSVCGLKEHDPQLSLNVTANATSAATIDTPGIRQRLRQMHEALRLESVSGNGDRPARLDGLKAE